MNHKHFIIYYKKGTGTYVVTEPRPWARENRKHFVGYSFIGRDHPKTKYIEDFLINNFGFVKKKYPNELVTVLTNLNPNINL